MEELILRSEAINALQNSKLKVKIKGIITASKNAESNNWLMVTRLADIVNDELYVEDFATYNELARFMGMSGTYIRRMVKAHSLHENELFKNMSVSKVCEFVALTDAQLEAVVTLLVERYGTLDTVTVKAIRTAINDIKKLENEDAEAEAEVEEAEAEVEEVEEVEAEVAGKKEILFTPSQVTKILVNLGHSMDTVTDIMVRIEKGEYQF